MAQKRKHTVGGSSDNSSRTKKSRSATSYNPSSTPQLDHATGQRSAFPGLDISYNEQEDQEDGTSAEALAYLRYVRSEAYGIPSILVTSGVRIETPVDENGLDGNLDDEYDDEEGEVEDEEYDYEDEVEGGYYDDGAYIVQSNSDMDQNNTTTSKKDHRVSPDTVYRASLLRRYEVYRRSIEAAHDTAPQKPAPAPLPYINTIRHARNTELYTWLRLFTSTPPTPSHLQTLRADPRRALKLAEIVSQLLRRQLFAAAAKDLGTNGARSLGMWIWGLLGVLPESWTMGNEEMGVVRGLGKKAVKIVWSLQRTVGDDVAEEVDDVDTEEQAYADVEETAEQEKGHDYNERVPEQGVATEELEEVPARTRPPTRGNRRRRNSSSSLSSVEHNETTISRPLPSASSPTLPTLEDSKRGIEEDSLAAKKRALLANLAAPPSISPTTPAQPPVASKSQAPPPTTTPSALMPTIEDASQREQEAGHILRFTLDAILTVVGEYYGQRDLLPARDALWEVDGSRE